LADRTIKRGDTGPPLNATLTDANGAINLTTATQVKILFASIDADPVDTFSGICTIVDAALGKVRFTWASDGSSTNIAATYNVEFEITWGDGTKWTVPNAAYNIVEIMPDLG
jgi:hypothetical protein